MKKIITVSFILLMTICMIGNVYAVETSCNIRLYTAKTTVAPNEEFTVDINLADIQSDDGIMSLRGVIGLTGLQLVKMEGKNNWETPTEANDGYNPVNGIIVIQRGGDAKSNETVLTLTLRGTAEGTGKISFTNISASDGNNVARPQDQSIDITIKKADTPTPPNTNTTENPNTNHVGTTNNITINTNRVENQNNTNQTVNVTGNMTQNKVIPNTNNSNTVNGKLPQTGENDVVNMILVGVAVAILGAIVFFVKIRRINKK